MLLLRWSGQAGVCPACVVALQQNGALECPGQHCGHLQHCHGQHRAVWYQWLVNIYELIDLI
jgi:hypothetical protein